MSFQMARKSKIMTRPFEASAKHFVGTTLPLYHGPLVKICLQPSNKEYMVSKELLCAESSVFLAMFKPGFRESQDQTVTLQEKKSIISTRAMEALIQWLYLRTINFDITDSKERISAAMELARLAEKYDITKIESELARIIKDAICNPGTQYAHRNTNQNNTISLTSEHIVLGTSLSFGHPVRCTLAAACVAGYLKGKVHQFAQEARDYPSFGADLLREVRVALNGLTRSYQDPHSVFFIDPFDNKTVTLCVN